MSQTATVDVIVLPRDAQLEGLDALLRSIGSVTVQKVRGSHEVFDHDADVPIPTKYVILNGVLGPKERKVVADFLSSIYPGTHIKDRHIPIQFSAAPDFDDTQTGVVPPEYSRAIHAEIGDDTRIDW